MKNLITLMIDEQYIPLKWTNSPSLMILLMLLLSSQLNSTLREPVGPTIFLSTSAVF